jgi:c(7)-type cytochrome triheme protein
LLAVVVCFIVAVAWITLAGSRGDASPAFAARVSPPLELAAQDETDFSKFSHTSARHASLACASCHVRAADNSTVPRLPGHKACTDCHLAQFVTPNAAMCAICHATVEGENPPVKNFPALRSFNARFDHAQHNAGAARPPQGCVACHAHSARRAASLTITASFNAHAECYTCHTPNAQSAGRDISTCGVCHTTGARFFRTPTLATAFRVGFSHATHGARERLSCADCHQLRAGAAQSRQVASTLPTEHFAASRAQSCATCHNNRRSFGDADFNDCRRCHKGQTFRAGI